MEERQGAVRHKGLKKNPDNPVIFVRFDLLWRGRVNMIPMFELSCQGLGSHVGGLYNI